MKVTEWIDASIPPVRKGEYEVRNTPWSGLNYRHRIWLNICKRRYWDGKQWLTNKGERPSVMGVPGKHEWRGVAKP